MSDWVGKVDRKARKPYITEEIINKMDERRKWKNVNNEGGRNTYQKTEEQIERSTDKVTMEYSLSPCEKIVEFQRIGRYDLMYTKTKELGKKNNGIQNIRIEYSQEYVTVDQRQVLEIWKNYLTELYDHPNRPENLNVELEEEMDASKGPYIL
jgi:hypothetical protein